MIFLLLTSAGVAMTDPMQWPNVIELTEVCARACILVDKYFVSIFSSFHIPNLSFFLDHLRTVVLR